MVPQRSPRTAGASSPPAAVPAPPIDWAHWLRETERKRRLLGRQKDAGDGTPEGNTAAPWPGYYTAATESSFRLDGLTLPNADLASSLARGWAARGFGSRQQQRARNHVAILRGIERMLRHAAALKPADVVRWYTSVASGLSTTRLDDPTASRLDAVVRQVNSPHLRLGPAVQGIARLHRQMLADPVVPSFNGILARLVLRYHLGRCGLPPVLFVPETDAPVMLDESHLLARLLERIGESYALMLGAASNANRAT